MSADAPHRPEPLRVSRRFRQARDTVFAAWSTGDAVARWFCPNDFTIPEALVEMRPGGRFEIRMRGPDGAEHFTRGHVAELRPPERLVLDLNVSDAEGRPMFDAYTEVDFVEEAGGTRMSVVQSYTFTDPAFAAMAMQGAPEGWRQTLDRLEMELSRGGATGGVVHDTFRIERRFPAPAARVFRAFADEAAKSRWFGGADGKWALLDRQWDFRVGGRERLKGRWDSGTVSTFDAVYHDIVPDSRIVYTYEMHLDDRKISVSLATIEVRADGEGTRLVVTEQGAYLDGYDDAGSRERGTGWLMDKLGASLDD